MENEISEFENLERDFSRKGTINNLHNFFAALSNRRLSVQSLGQPIILNWSIDRITIVGKLKEKIHIHHENLSVDEVDFEMLMNLNEGQGYLEKISYNSWQVKDKWDENIAYIELLKYQKGYGRIDFNPNKINQFVAGGMKTFIHKLFTEPHFSRADIACDIIDIPNEFIRQYRIIDPVRFMPIFGKNFELETSYWGARSSERQVRMYNKLIEQRKKKAIIPKESKTWWRVELQLRREKATNWYSLVDESLNSFCSPHFLPLNIKWTDRVMLAGLMTDENLWSGLGRNTKYKYRDLLKQESKNDELTLAMRETFLEQSADLKKELDSWLIGLDVSEEN
jgi:hypothetical protein